MAKGRTWREVKEKEMAKIKEYLIREGGEEKTANPPYELWRIKLNSATFTCYKKGTLYSTPPDANDQKVLFAWQKIDSILGPQYIPATKDILIGMDETGKGEIIGPMILTGVAFPKELFPMIEAILGPADTKKVHNFTYWDRIFKELKRYERQGLVYINHNISPFQIDEYNLNHLLDKGYHKILNILRKKVGGLTCRITIDDYGVGERFKGYLGSLKGQGNEVNIMKDVDERYLEVKAAAIISKRFRERVLKGIKKNPKYQIEGITVGSGNLNDEETKEWLKRWYKAFGDYPWFVKRSFKTIRGIERASGSYR